MQKSNNEIIQIPEPRLEFRYSQKVSDPRDGLSIFGAGDIGLPSHPSNISYGLIGTPNGIRLFSPFARVLQSAIVSESDPAKLRIWPAFPGFYAAFACSFPEAPTRISQINETSLLDASMKADPNQRAFAVVDCYLSGIRELKNLEDSFDVFICVVPDLIQRRCRPKSYVKDATGPRTSKRDREMRAQGQTVLDESYDVEPYQYSVDFRRQLKARCMEFEIPIQIVLESTLESGLSHGLPRIRKTPLSDRAWNLSTTIFYKANGKPWKLSSAREGVCYVGVTYRRPDQSRDKRSACCAAQMFLDDGDGVVIRGEYGPWYSEETSQFHLDRNHATKLLSQVLATYKDQHGKPLREVFLHYRASIYKSEYEGFKAACPPDVKVTAIRVRQERGDLRLFREGDWPVIRGTFWKINPRLGYLWASGFKPRLETYDGWEIPAPLRITLEFGETDIVQVATDILGLTKLNYNECRLGDAEPVTIKFSEDVGEILVSNPKIKNPNPKFKFYI